MSGRTDDTTLISACRAGDPQPFGVLVQRYQDRLYSTLLRLTGDPEHACDLVQDAFVRAWEQLERFRGCSSFYTWIYRIAVNLALTDRRRRKPPRSLGDLPRHQGAEPADPRPDADPGQALETAELEHLVQAALNRLRPDHRAVVVLKDVDGHSYEEIADLMGVPIGTVRSRLHRARGELRKLLRDAVEDVTVR